MRTRRATLMRSKRYGIAHLGSVDLDFPGVKLVKQRDFQQATRREHGPSPVVGCHAMSPDRQNFGFSG